MARNAIARHPITPTNPKTVKNMLNCAALEDGEKVAYKYRGKDGVKEVTYSEFQKDTIYLGTALADMGMANVLSNSARDKKRAERSKMGYMFDTLIHNNF